MGRGRCASDSLRRDNHETGTAGAGSPIHPSPSRTQSRTTAGVAEIRRRDLLEVGDRVPKIPSSVQTWTGWS